jgi:predicted kinase
VPGLQVANSSCRLTCRKTDKQVHQLVQKYKYVNTITAVTTETVPPWQLDARNPVQYKEQIVTKNHLLGLLISSENEVLIKTAY